MTRNRNRAPKREIEDVETLRARLDEAHEALRALASGEIDSITTEVGAAHVMVAVPQQHMAIFEAATDGMMVFDDCGRCLQANPAAGVLFGLSAETLTCMGLADIASGVQIRPSLSSSVETDVRFEAVIERSHRMLTVESRVVGNILPGLHLWVLRDVTESRATWEAQERLAAIVESSNDAIIGVDPLGRIQHVNRAAEELYGYAVADLLGKSPAMLERESNAGEWEAILARVMEGERVRDVQTVRRHKNGTLIDVSLAVSPIRDSSGEIVGASKIARDVTESRRAEERSRDLLESAPDGMLVADLRGKILRANRQAERLFDYARNQLTGGSLNDLIPQTAWRDQLAEVTDQDAPPRSRPAGGSETKGLRRDGSEFDAEITVSPFRGLGGTPSVIVAVRDVTERTKMRAQLALSDRMASIGSLAAGVAHEINNPLGAVIAYLDLALEDVEELSRDDLPVARLEEQVRDARGAATRLRAIVRDLTIFSRHEDEEPHYVDVASVLESTIRMAWNEIRHRARLVKDLAPTPHVLASESRLGQVFLNLLVNAAQAIPEGRANANQIVVRAEFHAGNVVITITDSGMGMAPEVIRQLFTPFFTTKPVGKGTGLGLSICHRIVTGYGGHIAVESKPGEGSTFRVSLPADRMDRSVELAATSMNPMPSRRGRILVIDDDRDMCEGIRRALSGHHEVVALNSAQVALSWLRSGERFDVILCDLMMPQITGMDFYAALTNELPEQAQRAIFLTGGAFTERAHAFLEETQNLHLSKPLDIRYLRKVVGQRIGQSAGGPKRADAS